MVPCGTVIPGCAMALVAEPPVPSLLTQPPLIREGGYSPMKRAPLTVTGMAWQARMPEGLVGAAATLYLLGAASTRQ